MLFLDKGLSHRLISVKLTGTRKGCDKTGSRAATGGEGGSIPWD